MKRRIEVNSSTSQTQLQRFCCNFYLWASHQQNVCFLVCVGCLMSTSFIDSCLDLLVQPCTIRIFAGSQPVNLNAFAQKTASGQRRNNPHPSQVGIQAALASILHLQLNALLDLSQWIVTFKSSHFPQVFHDVEAAQDCSTKL